MRLDGKVAIISGGARGIGAAEAKLFAREGAYVVICDLRETEGRQIESEIKEMGGNAVFIKLDVARQDEWNVVVNAAIDRFGRLDILVNNAGIMAQGTIEEMSVTEWDTVMDVNLKGVFLGTKAVLPHMKYSVGGAIINISSTSGIIGQYNVNAGYSASKGAIRLFTKATAVQYAADNIRVNSVHPGPITTPMTSEGQHDAERIRVTIANTPMGRYGNPEEVASVVLFLASDESSYITGSEVVVDGGYTAQ